MNRRRRLGCLYGLAVLPALCLLVSATVCVSVLWAGRTPGTPALNARLCLERSYTHWPWVISIGTYYRAGPQPLPAPTVSSYQMCAYVPWVPGLPAQGALVLPF